MGKIIKIVFVVLNALVALLYFASTLAGSVDPRSFIWLSILSYGLLYLLIANVLFVLIWLFCKSKWFLLSLAVILVRCSFLPLYFQVGGKEALSDDQIAQADYVKVLTFNAHHFQNADKDATRTDTNMRQFLDFISTELPDVIAMQEYVGRGSDVHLTEELSKLGYDYQLSGATTNVMTGEVMFSRYPLSKVTAIGSRSMFCADMIFADSSGRHLGGMPFDTVRIFCLHFHSYSLDGSDHEEIEKIVNGNMDSTTGRSTLLKFRETIVKHTDEWEALAACLDTCPHPAILMGDFNDTPASYLYQNANKCLTDSYVEEGQGFSTTYHGEFADIRRGLFLAYRIDYVLHTSHFKTLAYKRVSADISDHYPVLVALQLLDNKDKSL